MFVSERRPLKRSRNKLRPGGQPRCTSEPQFRSAPHLWHDSAVAASDLKARHNGTTWRSAARERYTCYCVMSAFTAVKPMPTDKASLVSEVGFGAYLPCASNSFTSDAKSDVSNELARTSSGLVQRPMQASVVSVAGHAVRRLQTASEARPSAACSTGAPSHPRHPRLVTGSNPTLRAPVAIPGCPTSDQASTARHCTCCCCGPDRGARTPPRDTLPGSPCIASHQRHQWVSIPRRLRFRSHPPC